MKTAFRTVLTFSIGSTGDALHYRKMRGVGLVEILVAITLGIFLVGTVTQTYLGSKQTHNMTEGMSRLQENYRFALQHFSKNLDSGGHAGCLENVPSTATTPDGTHISVLSSSSGANNYRVPVSGIEGGANPDTVIVTRANGGYNIPFVGSMVVASVDPTQPFNVDSSHANYQKLEQYQIVTLSDCTYAVTFMITNDPTSSGGTIQHDITTVSPGPLNPGLSNTSYFPTSVSAFGDGSVGSLSMLYTTTGVAYTVGTSATGTAVGIACNPAAPATHRYCALFANADELVEGVHDVQVTYGVRTGANIKFLNVNSLSATEAENVESVRLTLSMNSVRIIDDGDVVRRDFTKTFRVRNRNPL